MRVWGGGGGGGGEEEGDREMPQCQAIQRFHSSIQNFLLTCSEYLRETDALVVYGYWIYIYICPFCVLPRMTIASVDSHSHGRRGRQEMMMVVVLVMLMMMRLAFQTVRVFQQR